MYLYFKESAGLIVAAANVIGAEIRGMVIVLRASLSASDYKKNLTIQTAHGQLPQRNKLPFVSGSGKRLQTKPAQHACCAPTRLCN